MTSKQKLRWMSVELLPDKTIFLQPTSERMKHGPKGKVLLSKVLPSVAIKFQQDKASTPITT